MSQLLNIAVNRYLETKSPKWFSNANPPGYYYPTGYDPQDFPDNGLHIQLNNWELRSLLAASQMLGFALADPQLNGYDGGNDPSYDIVFAIYNQVGAAVRQKIRPNGTLLAGTTPQFINAINKARDMDGIDGFDINGNPNFTSMDLDRIWACYIIVVYCLALCEDAGVDDQYTYTYIGEVLGPLSARLDAAIGTINR